MEFEENACRNLMERMYRCCGNKMESARMLMHKLTHCVEAEAGITAKSGLHFRPARFEITCDTDQHIDMFFERPTVKEKFARIEKEMTERICDDDYRDDYLTLVRGEEESRPSERERFCMLWFWAYFNSDVFNELYRELEPFFDENGIPDNPFTGRVRCGEETWTTDLTDAQTYGYESQSSYYSDVEVDYYGYIECTALLEGLSVIDEGGKYFDETVADMEAVTLLLDEDYLDMYVNGNNAGFYIVKKDPVLTALMGELYDNSGADDIRCWIDPDHVIDTIGLAAREPIDLGEYYLLALSDLMMNEMRMLYAFKAMELREKKKTLEKGEDAA